MSYQKEEITSIIVSLDSGEEIEYKGKGIEKFIRLASSYSGGEKKVKKVVGSKKPKEPKEKISSTGYKMANLNYKESKGEDIMEQAKEMRKQAEQRLDMSQGQAPKVSKK